MFTTDVQVTPLDNLPTLDDQNIFNKPDEQNNMLRACLMQTAEVRDQI